MSTTSESVRSTIINPELVEDYQQRGHQLFSELMLRPTNNPVDDIIEPFAGRYKLVFDRNAMYPSAS